MTFKTILDCTRCSKLTECDAHMSDGKYKHNEGSNPCRLVFPSDVNDFEMVETNRN